jgi:PAS domain S-box-containing protein
MEETVVKYPFLAGGGEMGELIRSFQWSKTSIGGPESWPMALRLAISVILNSRFPMFIFWGGDLIQFYNDAYRPSLGINGKHPHALGSRGFDTWKEIWATIKPIIDDVLEKGEAAWNEDQLLPIYRNGSLEDVYWTYSYSPLKDDAGIPQGVLVTCYESTEKIKAFEEVSLVKDMYQFAVDAADLGIWDLNLGTNTFSINNRLRDWLDLEGDTLDLEVALNMIPAPYNERVKQELDRVLQSAGGGSYEFEHPIIPGPGKERFVRVKGKAMFDVWGHPYRFNGTMQDISQERSDRLTLIERENHLRNLFIQVPAAIAIFKGGNFIIELANDQVLEYWQKTYEQVIGKSVFDVLPLNDNKKNETLLRNVLATGEQYQGLEREVEVVRNDVPEKIYVNFVYEPYYESDGTISGVILIANEVTGQVRTRRLIEESEQRYEHLVEQAPVATAIYQGRQMNIQVANEAMLKLWGKPASVIGKKLTDVLPELEGQPFLKLLDHVYNTGETYWGKHDRVQLMIDGMLQSSYFNFTYKALRNSEGNIYGILNMAVDVTEMVIARRLLEESERNFKNMILQAPVAMSVLWGEDYVVEVANEKMYEIWGKGADELLRKPIFKGLPEARNQGLEPILNSVYKSANRYITSEHPVYLPRNGRVELTYLNFIYEPIRDKEGQVNRILAIAIEVTDQVLSRKKTEESEKQFRQMADSMPQIVWTALPDGKLDYLNKKWYDYTGFSNDFKDLSLIPVLHPDDSMAFLNNWNTALKEASEFEMEVRFADRKNSGSYIWFLCRATAIRDVDGRITKWFGTSTDIDDQKKQQQQKDEFISVASHELKTPLTTLKASLQLMSRVINAEDTSEKLKTLVEKTNYNLKKLSTLVDDLLSSTKIEQGQLILNKSIFILATLADECCDHVRLEGVHQVIASGDLELQVYADRQKIDQVIVNLVNNAVKYAPKSDKILINIGKEKDMVKVTVEDFGIGIPSEKIPHLFDRFYRVDVSGIQYSGLGLGLYISSEIVKRHGGRLGVESMEGHGSKFWFTLPALI